MLSPRVSFPAQKKLLDRRYHRPGYDSPFDEKSSILLLLIIYEKHTLLSSSQQYTCVLLSIHDNACFASHSPFPAQPPILVLLSTSRQFPTPLPLPSSLLHLQILRMLTLTVAHPALEKPPVPFQLERADDNRSVFFFDSNTPIVVRTRKK